MDFGKDGMFYNSKHRLFPKLTKCLNFKSCHNSNSLVTDLKKSLFTGYKYTTKYSNWNNIYSMKLAMKKISTCIWWQKLNLLG